MDPCAECLTLRHERGIDARRARMGERVLDDLRIIAANIGGARETAKIGGSGLLRRGQPRHVAQIGRDRGRKIGRHRRLGNAFGFVALPGNRHDERAHPPCGAILPREQRLQHELGAAPISRNHEAKGIAAGCLIILAGSERELIFALRSGVIADQIVGKAAIGGHFGAVEARLLCQIEPADRLERLVRPQHRHTHPRTHTSRAGSHLFGAGEEADGRIRIAQIERCSASIEQSGNVARIARQAGQRGVEHAGRTGRDRLDDRNRRRGDGLGRVVIDRRRPLLCKGRMRHGQRRADDQSRSAKPEPGADDAADHGADLIAAWGDTQSSASNCLAANQMVEGQAGLPPAGLHLAAAALALERLTGCSGGRGSAGC